MICFPPTMGASLSFMASLSLCAGDLDEADSYLLELLAWCAWAPRPRQHLS